MAQYQPYTFDDFQLYMKNRDKKSFDKLVRHYYPIILIFIHKRIKDRDHVISITSDTFLKFRKQPVELSHLNQVLKYLQTTAHRLCVDHLRKENKHGTEELTGTLENGLTDCDITDEMAYYEFLQALNEPIDQLPDQQKTVIRLLLYERLNLKEAADKMKIGYQTAANHKTRAIKSLKNMPLVKRILSHLCILLDLIQ